LLFAVVAIIVMTFMQVTIRVNCHRHLRASGEGNSWQSLKSREQQRKRGEGEVCTCSTGK
jgi:hypothetical protein